MTRSLLYTLPGGLPIMSAQMASLAILMFWKLPRMRMCSSAMTMRVRVEFSIANLVLPPLPEGGERGSGGGETSVATRRGRILLGHQTATTISGSASSGTAWAAVATERACHAPNASRHVLSPERLVGAEAEAEAQVSRTQGYRHNL